MARLRKSVDSIDGLKNHLGVDYRRVVHIPGL